MKFDRGYISNYFQTDAKTQRCDLEDCYVLLYENKISSLRPIVKLLETVFVQERKSLLIIAEDVDGEALAALIINRIRGGAKVCAVKAPGFGDNRKGILEDLATLTGGTVISDDTGTKLENVTLEQLGQCKRALVGKDDTAILEGAGSEESVKERTELIKESIKSTTSEYEKEKLQQRLGHLAGGVAVIRVGGSSDVEVGEKKDRYVDALNATRAAVEEGIVPGGGVALLYSTLALKNLRLDNADQQVGVRLVRDALQVPAKSIIYNAGLDGAVVVGKLLEDAKGDTLSRRGMNAATGQYVDMIQAGVIDPLKVVRTALVDASGVASLMTTTEVGIVEGQKEKSSSSSGSQPSYNASSGF